MKTLPFSVDRFLSRISCHLTGVPRRCSIVLSIWLLGLAALLVTPTVAQLTETKLIPTDGASDVEFGWSTSISGDYALVGAPYDNDNGTNSGSAYIFHREGTSWIEEAKLIASDGAYSDNFGTSVSLSGDYALIGAWHDDDKANNSGAAYVFRREETDWVQEAKLTASDGDSADWFGNSVAISEEYAVVGAFFDDHYIGSAYVFRHDGTNWTEEAKLRSPGGVHGDNFAASVSIFGNSIVVGSPGDNGDDTGAAYVFRRYGNIWILEATLVASDGTSGDSFGNSVSISGDYVIVGAQCDDDGGECSGSAYVFKHEGTQWIENAKLTARDAALGDFFGRSVSISRKYLVIGASEDDRHGFGTGSAYIFRRDGTIWTQRTKLVASDGGSFSFFGRSVSISGEDAVVGAWYSDDAYVYSGFTATSISTTAPDPDEDAPEGLLVESGSEPSTVPTPTALLGVYPNPFNPSTTIRYNLRQPSGVKLTIHNMIGQLVKTVVNGYQTEGYHEVKWDGRNEMGGAVASGIYVYRLVAGTLVQTRKMLLMK